MSEAESFFGVRCVSWRLAIGMHGVEFMHCSHEYCGRQEVAQQACLATLPALAKYYDCMPIFCSRMVSRDNRSSINPVKDSEETSMYI
eukprot:scaffold35991_cov21-Prasinocladus_malaysianus.AAC.1